MSRKTLLVVFGGTGDLMKRKLAPAFAKVIASGAVSKDSAIIGVSRKNLSHEEYCSWLVESLNEQEKKDLASLKILYAQGDASQPEGLDALSELLKNYEGYEKVFYLAVSFNIFSRILSSLEKRELLREAKIVFEKPFGSDLKSSDQLDAEIHKYFPEDNIYRIDHYLAKETVLNLTTLKFSNPMIEAILRNEFVETIEVIADEDLGVGNRINYYNDSGAIKDMIQSHLLQVLALLLIDQPSKILPEEIHREKVKVLSNIGLAESQEHLLGQYESYPHELSKAGLGSSKTETFAKLFLNCNTERWKGVRLILRTGKKLPKKYGQIKVTFKKILGYVENKLTIDIFPKQDIVLTVNARVPGGTSETVKPVRFEFCRDCEFGPNSPDEYAVLLQEIIEGNRLLFPKYEEIRESWRIVDEIEKMKGKMKFVIYIDRSEPQDNFN